MSDATGKTLRKSLRQLSPSTVLTVQIVLGAATVILSWAAGWQATVAGLVLMHVFTALVTLGPWAAQRIPAPASKAQLTRLEQRVDTLGKRVASKEQLTKMGQRIDTLGKRVASKEQLTKMGQRVDGLGKRVASKEQMAHMEQRIDGLGARLVASSERTRVEVLDALAQSRIEGEDRPS